VHPSQRKGSELLAEIIGHSLTLQGRAVVLVAAIEVAERVAARTSRRQSALARRRDDAARLAHLQTGGVDPQIGRVALNRPGQEPSSAAISITMAISYPYRAIAL